MIRGREGREQDKVSTGTEGGRAESRAGTSMESTASEQFLAS